MTGWDWLEGPARYSYVRASEQAVVNQAGRDLIVQNTGPSWRIDAMPLGVGVSAVGAARVLQQPSRLLRTRDEVVEFTGRATELGSLREWRDAGESALIRLVHGQGGEGKTRLARHVAREWSREGWTALQARHARECLGAAPGVDAVVDEAATGVLIVVDYAERWPERDLLGMIREARYHWAVPTRFLLLSRPTGVWWERLEYLLLDQLDLCAEAWRLDPLGIRPEDREPLFRSACAAFAKRLGVSEPGSLDLPPGLFSEESYSLVLTIHMAALAAVDARQRGVSAPDAPSRLSVYLLQREREYWTTLYENNRAHTDPDTLNCAVYAASLCGPVTHTAANSLVADLDIATGAEASRKVVRDHSYCYPSAQERADSFLEPLHPDRLAEDFMALTLPGHALEFTANPWATAATTRILASGTESVTAHTRRALTVLIEMASRWRHIAIDHLTPFLAANPAAILNCEDSSMVTLAANSHIGIDVLLSLEPTLRNYRGRKLTTGLVAVLNRIAEHRLAHARDRVERAAIHHDMSASFHLGGLYPQAVAAAEQEVALRRELAAEQPDVHRPSLAGALLNLCAMLTEAGQRHEAHIVSTEALAIRRELNSRVAETRSGATEHVFQVIIFSPTGLPFETALALSLLHYADWLFEEVDPQEAIDIAEEAVTLLRQLVDRDPGRRAELAAALASLAKFQSRQELLDAATAATVESVEIYRGLTADNGTHQWEFLVGLTRLSGLRRGTNRLAEAADLAREAVATSRRLAVHDRGYSVMLAYSLSTLCQSLQYADPRAAFDASTEAVRIYRGVSRRDSGQRKALASTLSDHTNLLAKRGQISSALATSEEALNLARAVEPADHFFLGCCLTNASNALLVSGNVERGFETAMEAVKCGRALPEDAPRTQFFLLEALTAAANVAFTVGHHLTCVNLLGEAVDIHRRFAESRRSVPLAEIRLNMVRLRTLVSLGPSEEIDEIGERTIALCRSIAPQADAELASVMMLLSAFHRRNEDWDRAYSTARDAVTLLRPLSADLPVLRGELSVALTLLGGALFYGTDEGEGLPELEQAVAIARSLYRETAVALPALLESMTVLSYIHCFKGNDDIALALTDEALSLACSQAAQGFSPLFMVSVQLAYVVVRAECGTDLDEAVRVGMECVDLCEVNGERTPLLEEFAESMRHILNELREGTL